MQNNRFKILFLGDIFGSAGRNALKLKLKEIQKEYKIDFTIANGENSAGGVGLTPKIAEELFSYGIDVITSGNHIWRYKEIVPYLKECDRLLRPANYPPLAPGKGFGIYKKGDLNIGVINILGRVFMESVDCPFRTTENIISQYMNNVDIIIVDLHAEATSEKQAFAWYFDGKVSAIVGTHTHVQTSDALILPNGTGYITDVGMTGPHLSVIGMKKEVIIERFLTGIPKRGSPAKDWVRIEGAILEFKEKRCVNIYTLRIAL